MGKYNINSTDPYNDDYNGKLNSTREKQGKKGTGRMKSDYEIEKILTAQEEGRQKNKVKKRKDE